MHVNTRTYTSVKRSGEQTALKGNVSTNQTAAHKPTLIPPSQQPRRRDLAQGLHCRCPPLLPSSRASISPNFLNNKMAIVSCGGTTCARKAQTAPDSP